jgi:hypothetical protein
MKFLPVLPLIFLLIVAFGFASAASARNRIIEAVPGSLRGTRSLGDLIEAAGTDSVHILFVHGMRAVKPGESAGLRAELLRRYGGSEEKEDSWHVNLGVTPPNAWVGTSRIWSENLDLARVEWAASSPFVDRYTLALDNGATVIVDEVNWWPILFPIKCRQLLVPEHHLSGKDKGHLILCSRNDRPFYPWISPEERDHLLATRPRSGGGAFANRRVKQEIMNWGLSDAVIALGPMRLYLVEAMRQAFEHAEDKAKDASERAVISASLGSFVVLDAYRGSAHVQAYLRETDNLYFFANQFALLELARIEFRAAGAAPAVTMEDAAGTRNAASAPSPLTALEDWASQPSAQGAESAGRARPK